MSSTEAEYIALSDCSRQCVWIRSILLELDYNFGFIHINGNKLRNKYIDIQFYAIYKFVVQGKVKLFYIEGNENPTNLFTKNLGQIKFQKFGTQFL